MRTWVVLVGLLMLTPGQSAARESEEKRAPVESSFGSKLILKHEPSSFEKCAEGAITLEDPQASLEFCDEAAAEEPDNGDVFYYRGFHFFELERIEEAEADFSRAIALNTRRLAESYFQRGVCKERQRRLREAAADFKKAHELKPDWSPARRKFAEYQWAYE